MNPAASTVSTDLMLPLTCRNGPPPGDTPLASIVDPNLLSHELGDRCTPDYTMSWRKGGYQSFQVMWSTKLYSNCVPPLQVRSFTSDSYRAIKERERKRDQQKKAASKQCRTLPHTEARREFVLLDAAVDVLRTGMELDDDIHTSDSRSLQPVPQEGCRVQLDGEIQ